jgi:CAAX prenyl protease-like protein
VGAEGKRKPPKEPRDSGWAPYWLPMLAFLLSVEVGRRVPEVFEPVFLVLRVAAPAGFFVYFLRRNRYPELRGARWGALALADVAVGLLGAFLWMAPFVLFDGLRPDEAGFDTTQLGEEGVALTLFLRFAGYTAVTPFVEELFVRSWLLRYVHVVDTGRDFRGVPIALFTWRTFLVVTFYFVFSHADWEWGVMAAWTLLTMAWFYWRGHLAPLVLVHAVTNGAIFLAVVLLDGVFRDASGAPISLWFFL